ncbi:M15 family metallopeptidase [Pseudohongiella sp.]|uniref:D-alanyl-D-alanine carboxypeptidase-like core domain-containing protein n=1 Tax=marine sediment metagenome TaxID=412755 RepID=A0A0F9Y0W1_9ZZZZ|nr:M15 family metallopeptidase [Pseudohongiella sp.]HDZ10342.1 D-alanyl-D-alanine carboxypeptidase family protein [Pseudohongiella sp.]HEA62035.1 D-alanyl-D-alanine carboxypeptidase family protein [Pseudohongiella sp.]
MVKKTENRVEPAYITQIKSLHAALGIADDYGDTIGLPLQAEPAQLVAAGPDMFGRSQQMTPATLAAWHAMRDRAAGDGVSLLLVSAYRAAAYQADVIRRKLDSGRTLDDILRVNAAPGYSEHHTGRALDIATPDSPPLETVFDQTAAFAWLMKNADEFGFVLSYPEGSASAITYEPWHWCFSAARNEG